MSDQTGELFGETLADEQYVIGDQQIVEDQLTERGLAVESKLVINDVVALIKVVNGHMTTAYIKIDVDNVVCMNEDCSVYRSSDKSEGKDRTSLVVECEDGICMASDGKRYRFNQDSEKQDADEPLGSYPLVNLSEVLTHNDDTIHDWIDSLANQLSSNRVAIKNEQLRTVPQLMKELDANMHKYVSWHRVFCSKVNETVSNIEQLTKFKKDYMNKGKLSKEEHCKYQKVLVHLDNQKSKLNDLYSTFQPSILRNDLKSLNNKVCEQLTLFNNC